MESGQTRKFLATLFGRGEDAAAFSRRDMLAGMGLAGLFVAAAKVLPPSAAEAGTLAPAAAPEPRADAEAKATEHSEGNTADGEVTDLSSRHRWRWRRRYWRRRHWRRRFYWRRRRYWRRRYWRRRYWRRRYW